MTVSDRTGRAEAGTIAPGAFWEHGKPGGFLADGKKSGHAFGGWVPAPDGELADPVPWEPDARHPVIAVLDSGVQPHAWLTGPDGFLIPGSLPFLQDADGVDGWSSPIGPVDLIPGLSLDPIADGTHWGHGTFIAGLIRQAAPQARILSMRVMDSAGHVDDQAAIDALNWLSRPGAALPKIVLMAFGRLAEPDDTMLPRVRDAVRTLTDADVQVVASAGNDGSGQPVYPAAFAAPFAAEPGLPVISVGAIRSRTEMEPYSSHGPWVRVGWIGSDIVSIHPLTVTGAGQGQISASIDDRVKPVVADSYAWWSGTSFAAALVAAQLARGEAPGLALPLTAAQP